MICLAILYFLTNIIVINSDSNIVNNYWCKSDVCFQFNQKKVRWNEGQEQCAQDYGYMLDDTVQQNIWNEFSTWNGNITEIWMAMKKEERYLQWVGRKPVLSKFPPRNLDWKWMPSEPNLVNGGSCVLGTFNRSSAFLKTHPCRAREQFVCVVNRNNIHKLGKPKPVLPDIEVTMTARVSSGLVKETTHLRLSLEEFQNLSLHCNIATILSSNITTIQSLQISWIKDSLYLPNDANTLLPTLVNDVTRTTSPPETYYTRQGVYGCVVSVPGYTLQFKSNMIYVELEDILNVIVTTTETSTLKDVLTYTGEMFPQELIEELETDGISIRNISSWDQLHPTYTEHTAQRVAIQRYYYFYITLRHLTSENIFFWTSQKNNKTKLHFPSTCREENILRNNMNLTFDKTGADFITTPAHTLCMTSDMQIQGRQCHWGIPDAKWLDFPNEANCTSISDLENSLSCLPEEVAFEDHCVKITQPRSWKEASELCTARSTNVTQNVLRDVSYLENVPEYLWLPFRRLWPAGAIIDLERSGFSLEEGNLTSVNVSWGLNEPSREMNCLLFNTVMRTLSMADCDDLYPTMCIVSNVDNFENIRFSNNECPSGWFSDMNICYKIVTQNSYNLKSAYDICNIFNSHLVSSNNMHKHTIIKTLVLQHNITLPVWIDMTNINMTLYSEGDAVNPMNLKFAENMKWNQKYGVFEEEGINFYDNSFQVSSVICEEPYQPPSNKLMIEKSIENSKNIHVRFANDFDAKKTQCYWNGRLVKSPQFYKTGYYQCHTFRSAAKKYLESNIILYRNPNEMIYIIQLQDSSTSYNPLIHDPTFSSFDAQTEHYTDGLYDKLKPYFQDFQISISNFSDDNMSGFLNIYLTLQVPGWITDESYVHNKLYNILFHNSRSDLNDSLSIITVTSTTTCQEDEVTVWSPMGMYKEPRQYVWPTTQTGMCAVTSPPCRNADEEPAVRCCVEDFTEGAYWESSYITCEGSVNASTLLLWELSRNNSIQDIAEVLQSHSAQLNYDEIFYLTKSLENRRHTSTRSDSDLNSVVSILNDVMETDSETLKTSQRLFNSSNRILSSMESTMLDTILSHNGENVNEENLAAQVWDIKSLSVIGFTSQQSEGVRSVNTLYTVDPSVSQTADAALILPEAFVERSIEQRSQEDNSSLRLSFAVYKNEKLFQPVLEDRIVNSVIVQASTKDVHVQNINPPVKLYFKPLHTHRNGTTCVFWDFYANNNNGGWSTNGCVYAGYQDNHDICLCNHLTSFAVLISYYDQEDTLDLKDVHIQALDIISVIGCSISLFGQVLVFVTFALFKQWRKPQGNKIVVNLCFALFSVYILFLGGFRQTDNEYVCIGIAVALHYFLLAAFFWMLVEAFHQYLRFVKVVGTYIPKFMLKASLISWGLPLIPVIVVLGYDYKLYIGGDYYCWMSKYCFYYTFLVPLLTILTTNVIIYILIIQNIYFREQLRSNQSNKTLAKSQFRMAISIFILIGLTWVFGTLAINDAQVVFSYLFCIFSTLQGFFIFVFHILHEKMSMNLWTAFLSVCSKYDSKSIKSDTTSQITSQASMEQDPFQQEKGRYIPIVSRQSVLVFKQKEEKEESK